MAYLLVQMIDEVHEDFYLNARLPKQGDVIHIHRYPNSWSTHYLTDTRFDVFHIDATPEELWHLLSPEPFDDITNIPLTNQHRFYFLDTAQLQQGMSLPALSLITSTRPPIEDPNVF